MGTSGCVAKSGALRGARSAAFALAVLLAIAGCGGGSGSGEAPTSGSNGSGSGGVPDSGSGRSSPPAAPSDVAIRVIDALGRPVADTWVNLNLSRVPLGGWGIGAKTSAEGRVLFEDVPSTGHAAISIGDEVSGWAGRSEVDPLPSGTRVDVDIAVRPYSLPSIGIAAVRGGSSVSADRRELDVTLRLYPFSGDPTDSMMLTEVGVDDCLPDPTTTETDCTVDPGSFDTPYSVASEEPIRPRVIAGEAPKSVAATLVIDSSRRMAVADPNDDRLDATKFYLTGKTSTTNAALAAFASDDVARGELATLPQKPVTFFPLENPQMSSVAGFFFESIDQLSDLEGGVSPLYPAIVRAIDFTTATAGTAERRFVVVPTAGDDETCGADCAAARAAATAKSATSGVSIAIVALTDPLGRDAKQIAQFAELSGSIALWAATPRRLSTILSASNGMLDGSARTAEIDVHLVSTVDQAFAAGNVVLGTLHASFCYDWYCEVADAPFAVRVP